MEFQTTVGAEQVSIFKKHSFSSFKHIFRCFKHSFSSFKHSFNSFKHSFSSFKHSFSSFKHSFSSFKHSFNSFKHSFSSFKHSFSSFKHSFSSFKHSFSSFKHSFSSFKHSFSSFKHMLANQLVVLNTDVIKKMSSFDSFNLLSCCTGTSITYVEVVHILLITSACQLYFLSVTLFLTAVAVLYLVSGRAGRPSSGEDVYSLRNYSTGHRVVSYAPSDS